MTIGPELFLAGSKLAPGESPLEHQLPRSGTKFGSGKWSEMLNLHNDRFKRHGLYVGRPEANGRVSLVNAILDVMWRPAA